MNEVHWYDLSQATNSEEIRAVMHDDGRITLNGALFGWYDEHTRMVKDTRPTIAFDPTMQQDIIDRLNKRLREGGLECLTQNGPSRLQWAVSRMEDPRRRLNALLNGIP